ncbi:MAG TPA: alpha/beta fold hydrolase, partial [Anaerolineaceae bacterium]|nr:alpha/beta fold hydrolase [Anaerolineaceae bacterium]
MEDSILRNPHLEGGPFFWKAGPVGVLLLHGMTSTTAEMRPFARFLYERGYTVAGPLFPGHGTTPQDLSRRKWTEWAASAGDAYQYLTSICDQVFVAGASMGGLLALFLASKQAEITGLLLYAPALYIPRAQYAYLFSLFVPSVRKRPGGEWMPWQGYRVNPLGAVAQLYRLQ